MRCIRALLVLLLLPVSAFAVPTVQEVKTKSGLTAWLIEDHRLPIVSLRASFEKSGAAYDTAHPGLPLLATRMLSEGAGDLTSEAFAAALQDDAIGLGFEVDRDRLGFSVDALSEHFARGVGLAGSALTAPRLEAGDLAQVREEISVERRVRLQSPGYLADLALRKRIYSTHPYGVSMYGDESAMAGYDAAAIRAWLSGAIHRGELRIAVVGDITPAALAKLLDESLGKLSATSNERSALQKAAIPATAETIHQDAPFPQTAIVFASPGVTRNDPDFYAAYLMNHLLGGGALDSRLSTEIRKNKGLTYSVSTGLVPEDASPLLRGQMATRGEQADNAVTALRDVYGKAQAKGFTAEELKDAKDYVTGSFPLDIDANAELVGYLLMMQVKHLPKDYLAHRNAILEAVTLADVNRVAKRLLDPKKLVVATVGETAKP